MVQQQQKPDTRYVQLGQLFLNLVMWLSTWTYDGASEERDAARAIYIVLTAGQQLAACV